jgi:alpha-mannosidase
LEFEDSSLQQEGMLLPEVPGCGYAAFTTAAPPSPVALANGLALRNELLDLTVSETTGGIQSLRTHRDRSTRASQRLVFHDSGHGEAHETKMVAERIEITRNDALVGQITSHGRLLDPDGQSLARFSQTMRLVRGLSTAIVDVQLDPERLPQGDIWNNYFASRIAWAGDAIALRRGIQCTGREIARERIESPEWIEIDDGTGKVTCFALGLPFHRQAGPTWLDSLLMVPGQTRRRFQFALGVDEKHPTQIALGLVAAGQPLTMELPTVPNSPTGWFLHVGAKNVLLTHVEPLAAPQSGVRLRLLETEGRDTHTTLAAFRPFHTARTTDFRGQPTGVLSVTEGRADFDIGPYRWIQIEAEW